jgi:hypothetical protein
MNKVFWSSAIFAVAVLAGCSSSSPTGPTTAPADDERWSAFPH